MYPVIRRYDDQAFDDMIEENGKKIKINFIVKTPVLAFFKSRHYLVGQKNIILIR